MFMQKSIKAFTDHQLKWLKSIDFSSDLTHAQFAERMSDEEKTVFLKESDFIEDASSEAIHSSGLFDVIDFVEIVRGDIIYLETFKSELSQRSLDKNKRLFGSSGYYAKSLILFYLFMFTAILTFTFSVKVSAAFIVLGIFSYAVSVLLIPSRK